MTNMEQMDPKKGGELIPHLLIDVLLNKISMTASGDLAMQTLDQCTTQYKGQFILIIAGAVHPCYYIIKLLCVDYMKKQ